MGCVPAASVAVLHAAVRVLPEPAANGRLVQPPIGLPSSVKLTLPVGLLVPVTVAVKVTLAPATDGLAELPRVVAVGAGGAGLTSATARCWRRWRWRHRPSRSRRWDACRRQRRAAGGGAGVAGAGGKREVGAAADRSAAVGEAHAAGRVVGSGHRRRESHARAGDRRIGRAREGRRRRGGRRRVDDLRQRAAGRRWRWRHRPSRSRRWDACRRRGVVPQAAVRVLPEPAANGRLVQPPIGVPPSVKLTLPVGLLVPVTVAVKVTLAPATDGLAELPRVVAVGAGGAGLTTCDSALLGRWRWRASPE